jgi:hypothetical protein
MDWKIMYLSIHGIATTEVDYLMADPQSDDETNWEPRVFFATWNGLWSMPTWNS